MERPQMKNAPHFASNRIFEYNFFWVLMSSRANHDLKKNSTAKIKLNPEKNVTECFNPCIKRALHYDKVMFSTYVDARSLKRVATKTIFFSAPVSFFVLCVFFSRVSCCCYSFTVRLLHLYFPCSFVPDCYEPSSPPTKSFAPQFDDLFLCYRQIHHTLNQHQYIR